MNQEKQITILMAVYNPNEEWFRLQLRSIKNQDYKNIKLMICDDCSPNISFDRIKEIITDEMGDVPCAFYQNSQNHGSNYTFEKLTQLADGDYIAYSDQDDVWHEDKLSKEIECIEVNNAVLACAHEAIIDENGKLVAKDHKDAFPFVEYISGEGLAEKLIGGTAFVHGCTILIRTEDAKSALPFCPYYYHDHYLAIWAANKGKIITLDESLVDHRVHGKNQTSALAGVHSKGDYRNLRIEKLKNRAVWLYENFSCDAALKTKISELVQFADARLRFIDGDSSAIKIMKKYKNFDKKSYVFERMFSPMPNWAFMMAVNTYRSLFK